VGGCKRFGIVALFFFFFPGLNSIDDEFVVSLFSFSKIVVAIVLVLIAAIIIEKFRCSSCHYSNA
jgi:hypothetical protein